MVQNYRRKEEEEEEEEEVLYSCWMITVDIDFQECNVEITQDNRTCIIRSYLHITWLKIERVSQSKPGDLTARGRDSTCPPDWPRCTQNGSTKPGTRMDIISRSSIAIMEEDAPESTSTFLA